MNSTYADAATVELQRYLALAVEGDLSEMKMFSPAVDAVWHDRLKEPEDYKAFSLDACGQVLGHVENSGEGQITWIPRYETRFGKLDPVWFADAQGEVDMLAYQRYLDTGTIYASWECEPVVPTMD